MKQKPSYASAEPEEPAGDGPAVAPEDKGKPGAPGEIKEKDVLEISMVEYLQVKSDALKAKAEMEKQIYKDKDEYREYIQQQQNILDAANVAAGKAKGLKEEEKQRQIKSDEKYARELQEEYKRLDEGKSQEEEGKVKKEVKEKVELIIKKFKEVEKENKEEEEKLQQQAIDELNKLEEVAKGVKPSEDADAQQDQVPGVPPPIEGSKVWDPPGGGDNGEFRCWFNAPLYTILQNEAIRNRIQYLHHNKGGLNVDDQDCLEGLYNFINITPWKEEDYRIFIDKLIERQENENPSLVKLPPLIVGNEVFAQAVLNGGYYDAGRSINFLRKLLEIYGIYIYEIMTFPSGETPEGGICRRFDRDNTALKKEGDNDWKNCVEEGKETKLLGLVQSFNVRRRQPDGSVVLKDAGHFRSFIPVESEGSFNKGEFNDNYTWKNVDALNHYEPTDLLPEKGSDAYSFYIFLKGIEGDKLKDDATEENERAELLNRTKSNKNEMKKIAFFDVDETLMFTSLDTSNGIVDGFKNESYKHHLFESNVGQSWNYFMPPDVVELLNTLNKNNVDIYIVSAGANKENFGALIEQSDLDGNNVIKNIENGFTVGQGENDKINKINGILEREDYQGKQTNIVFVDDSIKKINEVSKGNPSINTVHVINTIEAGDLMMEPDGIRKVIGKNEIKRIYQYLNIKPGAPNAPASDSSGQGGGGKRRVRTNKKRKGRRVNRTEKKNRRSIRRVNRRSRKNERTPKKRISNNERTPKKRVQRDERTPNKRVQRNEKTPNKKRTLKKRR